MADIALVIKIDEKYLEDIKKCVKDGDIDYEPWVAIANGIPLEDVKTKLQKLAGDPWNMTVGSASTGLEDAIEMLDNIGRNDEE